jgi:cytochrome c oxidase cbb3-type subunit 3
VAGQKETDEVTGVETTGHEWDGIKELNMPLPRWWLWTFYVTIVWAIGYWIVMPAWPLVDSYTKGLLGHSDRTALAESLADAAAAQRSYLERIQEASLEEITQTSELMNFALAGGRSAFAVNCSQCHGLGAQGFVGYPNLNDDDWLWGGTLEAIATTIRFGIRSAHDDTRVNDMPAFLRDETLTREEVQAVAEHVLSLSGAEGGAASESGAQVFAENCVACHGEDAKGLQEMGAPNLTNGIWLYAGDKARLVETIANGRRGVMPSWEGRLDEATLKLLAVYVHSLGGGE